MSSEQLKDRLRKNKPLIVAGVSGWILCLLVATLTRSGVLSILALCVAYAGMFITAARQRNRH